MAQSSFCRWLGRAGKDECPSSASARSHKCGCPRLQAEPLGAENQLSTLSARHLATCKQCRCWCLNNPMPEEHAETIMTSNVKASRRIYERLKTIDKQMHATTNSIGTGEKEDKRELRAEAKRIEEQLDRHEAQLWRCHLVGCGVWPPHLASRRTEQLRPRKAGLPGAAWREQENKVSDVPYYKDYITGTWPWLKPAPALAAMKRSVEEVVTAMRAHQQVRLVQENGCAVFYETFSGGVELDQLRQRAVQAGALEAVVAAMREHSELRMQQHGCAALFVLLYLDRREPTSSVLTDVEIYGLRHRAAQAGTLEVMVSTMRACPAMLQVQIWGCGMLCVFTEGDAVEADLCRQHAVQAGALEEVVMAMRTYPQKKTVQNYGCAAIRNICSDGSVSAGRRALAAGATAVLHAAVEAHKGDDLVQTTGPNMIGILERLPPPREMA